MFTGIRVLKLTSIYDLYVECVTAHSKGYMAYVSVAESFNTVRITKTVKEFLSKWVFQC